MNHFEECQKLYQILLDNKLKLSTCESMTCGTIASIIGDIPGISSVYNGGLVVYTNEMKNHILKIDNNLLNTKGAVSAEVAKEMALKTNALYKSDICISITGNAGPTGSEDKPVGLCYVGICIVDICTVYELNLNGSERNENRIFGAIDAIRLLIDHLKQVIK